MSATTAQRTSNTEECHRGTAGAGLRLMEDPLGFVASVRSTEGVVPVRFGSREVYLVTSPDLVEEVLVDEKSKFDVRPGPSLGHGFDADPGSVRAAYRPVIESAFHWSRLADRARATADTTAERADSWSAGAELDIPQEMTRLALEAITRSLVAGRAGHDLAETLGESIPAMLDEFPVPAYPGSALPATPDAVRVALAEAVDHRRRSPEHHTDALSLMLSARSENGGPAPTDDELCEELLGLILAGTEAPAALLAWTLHEVSRRPDIEERILAEIAGVLGDRPPTAADFTALMYSRQVVGEALRCYARPFLLRRVTQPVRLGEWRLAPGDEVLISPYALHRDPALFQEPDRFDPYRYNCPAARRALIPFGADDRGCVGAGSAWQGMTIALVTMLARWTFRPISDQPVRPVVGRTVRPDRLVLAISPR